MRPPLVWCTRASIARAAALVATAALLAALPSAASAQAPACPDPPAAEDGFTRLWDGKSTTGWSQSGPGGFKIVDDGAAGCRLESEGGLGLFWYSARTFADYELRLQWRTTKATDNSGVFVRFPNPGADPFVAVDRGYELQIREGVQGDGEDQKTGSIYNTRREIARAAKPVGEWNDYVIRVVGQPARITITLNGTLVQDFTSTDGARAKPGYIGLQNHGTSDFVSFRDVRIRDLGGLEPTSGIFDSVGITSADNRGWSQIHGSPNNYSYPDTEFPAAGTFAPGGFVRTGGAITVPVRIPDTAGKAPNVASFSGQTLALEPEDRGVYDKAHFFGFTSDGSGGGDVTFKYGGAGGEEKARVAFDDWGCSDANANSRRTVIRARWRRSTTNAGGPGGIGFCIYHVEIDLAKSATLEQVVLPTSTTPNGGRWAAAHLLGITLQKADGTYVGPDLKAADKWAPTVTQSLAPGAPDGFRNWYRAAPSVTLTADDFGGAGLGALEYRVGDGAFAPYTAPFQPEGSGTHVVEYRARDTADNETVRSFTVNVDGQAPVSEAAVDTATLTLTAADEQGGSGVDAIVYRVEDPNDDDADDWRVYGGPIEFEDVGEHTVTYLAADHAGNAEAARTVKVTVPAKPPTGGTGSTPRDSKTPAPGRDAPAPPPGAWLTIDTPDGKRSLAAFRRRGLRVEVRCIGAEGTVAKLTVSRKTARKLGLKRMTLASAPIPCEPGAGSGVVLKAGKRVRKSLAKAKGPVRATLRVATTGSKSASDSASLVFRARG